MRNQHLILMGLLLLFTSCNIISSTQKFIRSLLFEAKIPTTNQVQEKNQQDDRPVDPDLEYKNAAEKLAQEELAPPGEHPRTQLPDQFTPRLKILNLCRGYHQSGSFDPSFKQLLEAQMQTITEQKIFTDKLDSELRTCLYNFLDPISEKDTNAIDLMAQWYLLLQGENKEEAAKVLATTLQHEPVYFIQQIRTKIKDQKCAMAGLIINDIRRDDWPSFLQLRREALLEIKDTLANNIQDKEYWQVCFDELNLSLHQLDNPAH